MTLMNTADGTRYTLVLKPPGTAVLSPATATTGSTGTVAVGSGSTPTLDDGYAPAGDAVGRALLSFRSTDRTSR